MGLFDFIFGEFIDVIDWTDDTQNTMVYRFPRYGNEIKYGAKLIVRESQQAVFVNEGEIADILGPGTYELGNKEYSYSDKTSALGPWVRLSVQSRSLFH